MGETCMFDPDIIMQAKLEVQDYILLPQQVFKNINLSICHQSLELLLGDEVSGGQMCWQELCPLLSSRSSAAASQRAEQGQDQSSGGGSWRALLEPLSAHSLLALPNCSICHPAVMPGQDGLRNAGSIINSLQILTITQYI